MKASVFNHQLTVGSMIFFPHQAKAVVDNVRHRVSALRTPVRRSLVPGVQGERLAHSLDINRPLPYKEIDRLITEQIVRSLPHRLSFHTGKIIWGAWGIGGKPVKLLGYLLRQGHKNGVSVNTAS